MKMAGSDIVKIEDVSGRADSGVSACPFRCRGDDGRQYYVKLGNAHPRGLIAEWVCGNLARFMGLPIADFCLVMVEPDLANLLPDEFSELGYGIGFGSVAAPMGHREVFYSDLDDRADPDVLAEILAFDAWIRNEDRKLGVAGGNPNALFVPNSSNPLLFIDHDSAFDESFDSKRFLNDHLARSQASLWIDVVRQDDWIQRASDALKQFPLLWESIPEEWIEDERGDPRPIIGQKEIYSILDRPMSNPEQFWNTTTP